MSSNGVVEKVAARLTIDISPAQQQLTQLSSDMKSILGSAAGDVQKLMTVAPGAGIDSYLQDAAGAIRTVRQQIQELQLSFKEGTIKAEELFSALTALRGANPTSFDLTTSKGVANDMALRSAIVSVEGELSKLHDFELQSELQLIRNKKANEDEYVSWWESQLQQQEVDYAKYLKQEEALDKAHYLALREDAKREMQAKMQDDKDYTAWWTEQLKQQEMAARAAQAQMTFQRTSHGSVFNTIQNKTPGFSAGSMMIGMVGFQAMFGMYQMLVTGMKDVEAGAAGLQQVFESQITSQSQLNSVTNDFVGIAQRYGESVSGILDAGKLWGRQYKDINTAMTLTNSSALLSIVDNVQLTTANRGLEATMNSMGMAADSQATAFANSMKIVDSWSALAHKASVSASDLVHATENSAGAARAAGVSFDQLQALITSGVRNTGLAGANVGNMLKSLFASIDTSKAQKSLQDFGITLTKVGQDGKTALVPVFDVLLQLSEKLQTANTSQQKLLETISGGKYQWSKVSSMLSDYNTIIDAYATSINSAGSATQYAQVQMHTFGRDLTRLQDTFTQLSAQTDQNGMGSFLKSIVEGITNVIVGLEQMQPWQGQLILWIGGLLVGLRSLTGIMNTLSPLSQLLIGAVQKIAPAMEGAATATDVEAGATKGLAAAFTTLDLVSGGLALIIGVVVTALFSQANASGQAKTATLDHTQALQDQIGVMQQQYNLALQKQQFMQTAISQEVQLKNALNDHTLTAKQHNQVLSDMVDLYRAVGKATGNEALQQVSAANVNSQTLQTERQAIDKLVQAKKTAYEDSVAINNKAIQNDINKTNQEITDINTHITALNKETSVAFSDLSFMTKLQDAGNVLLSGVSWVLGPSHWATARSAWSSAMNSGKVARDQQLQQAQSQLASLVSQRAQDQYKLASNALDLFNVNTGSSGYASPSSAGGIAPAKTKGAGSALSQYVTPFQNLSQNDTITLQSYTDRIKGLSDAYSIYNKQMTTQLSVLKQEKTSVNDVSAVMKLWNNQVWDLRQHQQALADENAKINQMLPQLQHDIANVNAQYANGTITAQEHRDAISNLNSEYQRLTSTLTQNKTALADDLQKIIDVSTQVNQWNFTNANNGITTMKDNIKSLINGEISQLDTQISAIDQQLSALQWNNQTQTNQDKMTKLQSEAAQWQSSTSVAGRKKYEDYLTQISDLQKQMNYDNAKHALDTQKQNLQDQKTALQQHLSDLQNIYSGFSDNVQSIMQVLQMTLQAQAKETNTVISGYLGDIAGKLQTLQSQFISVSSTGATTIGVPSSSSASKNGLNSYWQGVKTSGGQYGDPAAQGLTVAQSIAQQAAKYGISPSKVQVETNSSGQTRTFIPWQDMQGYASTQSALHMATGGQVPLNMGFRGMDSVPAMLTPGEIVVPSWNDLIKGFQGPSSSPITEVTINMQGMFDGAQIANTTVADHLTGQMEIRMQRVLDSRLRSQGIRTT